MAKFQKNRSTVVVGTRFHQESKKGGESWLDDFEKKAEEHTDTGPAKRRWDNNNNNKPGSKRIG